jgi:hydroxymethylglutaryl-CoA reductase
MMQQLSESTSALPELGYKAIPRPRARPRLRVLSRVPASDPTRDAAEPSQPEASITLDGLYTAPFGFVLHALVNQRGRCIPLVFEHAADLAVVRRALELVAADGGFHARTRHVWQVEAHIRLRGAAAARDVTARLREQRHELVQIATRAIPPCARGEAPLALELSATSADEVRLRLRLEASDDAGLESALHDAARAIAPFLIRVAGVRPSVRVSRMSSERARVSCCIQRERLLGSALASADVDGRPSAEHAVERATAALAAGAVDAVIAAAHNALIEHGIAAVALALGHAPARVASGLEQHAARWGGCMPLCTWRAQGDSIVGELELPIGLATHGRWQAQSSTDSSTDSSSGLNAARDIALLAACIGMAASIIALEDMVRARALEQRRPLPPPRRRRSATPVRAESPEASRATLAG